MALQAQFKTNETEALHRSRENCSSVTFCGSLKSCMVSKGCVAVSSLPMRMMCLQWSIVSVKNDHCLSLNVTLGSESKCSTSDTCSTCFGGYLENMMMSWRLMRANCHFTVTGVTFIMRWNVPGAFLSPSSLQMEPSCP